MATPVVLSYKKNCLLGSPQVETLLQPITSYKRSSAGDCLLGTDLHPLECTASISTTTGAPPRLLARDLAHIRKNTTEVSYSNSQKLSGCSHDSCTCLNTGGRLVAIFLIILSYAGRAAVQSGVVCVTL